MGVRVKICGLARAKDVLAVAECHPDAIGFVFWPGSKRAVRARDVAEWVVDLPTNILKVGVFVDATRSDIERTMAVAGLDIAQLHGNESPEEFVGFRGGLWRSVRLSSGSHVDPAAWHVDAYLIDTYSEEAPGGTGRVGDWVRAREFVVACSRPVWLAGGLTPNNVREAIRRVQPWGVDVSSGVEEAPGQKDLEKVKAFIEACRED